MKHKRILLYITFFTLAVVAHSQTISGSVLSLNDTLNTLNSPEFRWDPFFESGVISSGDYQAAFFAGREGETGPVLLNSQELVTLPLPYEQGGELRFPEAFVQAVSNSFMHFEQDDLFRFRIAAIVIDPGHGGDDNGASAAHTLRGRRTTVKEKDIVLTISKLLYSRLSAAYPDKRVMLTRDADYFVTLDDRVLIANDIPLKDNEAIIYISIHANAALSSAARGYEVWYLPPDFRRELITAANFTGPQEILPILNDMMQEEFNTESRFLAQGILRQFDEMFGSLMPSRGLKEEAWFVVRNARMPSVLVELGFVSNASDALLMTDEAHLIRFTEVLYNGITEFVTSFELSGGFTTY